MTFENIGASRTLTFLEEVVCLHALSCLLCCRLIDLLFLPPHLAIALSHEPQMAARKEENR